MTILPDDAKPIAGYESLYWVTPGGDVYALFRRVHLIRMKLGKTSHRSREPYRAVTLCANGRHTTQLVHRLVALAFLPSVPGCDEVNHKNGIKSDNRVENLEWVTRTTNVRHARDVLGAKYGGRGERSRAAKLCVAQVLEIRARAAAGELHESIRHDYGLSQPGVWSVITRRTWRHV